MLNGTIDMECVDLLDWIYNTKDVQHVLPYCLSTLATASTATGHEKEHNMVRHNTLVINNNNTPFYMYGRTRIHHHCPHKTKSQRLG